jgi:hypothetical protein
VRTLDEIVRRQNELSKAFAPVHESALTRIAREQHDLARSMVPNHARSILDVVRSHEERLRALQPKWWDRQLMREADLQRQLRAQASVVDSLAQSRAMESSGRAEVWRRDRRLSPRNGGRYGEAS